MNPIYFPHYAWAIVLALSLCGWCAAWVKPHFGAPAAALLGYLSLNAIWVWVWVENRYYSLNPYDQTALRYFAADSLVRCLALLVPMMLLAEYPALLRNNGKLMAKIFVAVNSLLVLASFVSSRCREVNSCGGTGNPSIMVGLSVCLLPMIIRSWRRDWVFFILVAMAVLISKSSVALGLLALYGAYLFLNKRAYIFAIGAVPLPLIAGYFLLGGKELFNSSDRFMIWQYMMSRWATWWNMAGGTGWGTYHVFSINLQNATHLRDGSWWDTLHNDWLQMIFECGLAGGALMVATYLHAFWRTVKAKDFALAGSIFLYGIYMGANPALHHAFPALFGAWLFVSALKKEVPCTELHLQYKEGESYV